MAIHVQIDPLERTATLRGVHSLCAGESSEVILSGVPDADTPTLSLRVYRDASESVQVACSVRPGTDPAEEGLVPVEGRAALRRGTLDLRTSAVSEWASEDAAAAAAADEARRSGSKEPEARAAASYRRPDSAWLVVADSSRVWAACSVPFVLRPFDDALSPDPEVPLPSYAERAEAAAAAAESAAQRAERAAEDAESAEATGKVGRDELFDDPDSASPKVKPSLLPSYVVEVAALPSSGESGKLYVVTGTNAVYRWSGSSFVEVSPSRDWSGELAAKRGLADFSVGDGWLLVKPDGAQAWLAPTASPGLWAGDGFELFLNKGGTWYLSSDSLEMETAAPEDTTSLEFSSGSSVYRLVRGSRLALDTEIPPAQVNADWNAESGVAQILNKPTIPPAVTVDNAVTRTGANPVKSSGIWAAIWGALTALPTGVASLYDWCVAQLAGKLDKSGNQTLNGNLTVYTSISDIAIYGGTSIQHLSSGTAKQFMFPDKSGTFALTAGIGHAGNLAALDANGNPTDSGTKPSDFADAADLRYLILGAIYNARDDFYILADRTVNLITASDETSIDIELPAAVTVGGVRRARDFFLDVDNSANASDLALEFTGLGVDYAFVPLEDDSISEMMTIGAGERVRLYFTETPYHANGSLPVINVARVTLGDFVTSTATQGGN